MKKFLITLIVLVFFTTPVMAATLVSDYASSLDQNETLMIAPVTLTSTADGDITSEYGIHLLLDEEAKILFDDRSLTYTGNAINNGRINLNVEATFAADYKSLFIPVEEDFEAGEWLQVQGLALRAYDDDFNPKFMGLDLDGDMVAEVSDINSYEVDETEDNDKTAPYPAYDVAYLIEEDGDVTLSWELPPDYDYEKTIINRTRTKDGYEMTSTIYSDYTGSFTDSDLDEVTFVSYSIVTADVDGNWSDAVVIEIDFNAEEEGAAEAEEEETADTESAAEETEEEGADASEEEVSELSRLLNYYNVRYSIKCMPSGVAVAENNSACLWARIDLLYAQELTGEEKVTDLALSERDLTLMETRRRWPEQRYEDNCITAAEPASYCPALGKALDRISYFLD